MAKELPAQHCLFAEIFPDIQIVNALRAQLSWTYIRMVEQHDLRGKESDR